MISRTTAAILYLGVFLFAGVLALPVRAQEKPADNMEVVREAVRAEKKLFIAQNMQLTESEAKAFWPIYDRFQQDQHKLFDQRMSLVEEYSKSYGSMTDAVAQALLEKFLAQEKARLHLIETYLPEFRKALPAVKVTRFFQLENKVKAVMDYEMAARIPIIQ